MSIEEVPLVSDLNSSDDELKGPAARQKIRKQRPYFLIAIHLTLVFVYTLSAILFVKYQRKVSSQIKGKN